MRIVVVGAVESSRVTIEELISLGCPPVAVVTLPLDKASRHSDFVDLRPAAARCGAEVVEVVQINCPEALDKIRTLCADYIAVIGWSQLCSPEFLAIPRYGCIGFHPALLPELRGRSVIAWTILLRLQRTGSSLFWLADRADTGDLLMQMAFDVSPDETVRTLIDKHMLALRRMWRDCIPQLVQGHGPCIPQDQTRGSYCARRTPADGWIDWTRPAEEVWTLIRAVSDPYPGAFTSFRGKKLTIWSAELIRDGGYIGLPGQVQAISDGGVLIQCGDGVNILARRVSLGAGAPTNSKELGFKMHERLGPCPVPAFREGEN